MWRVSEKLLTSADLRRLFFIFRRAVAENPASFAGLDGISFSFSRADVRFTYPKTGVIESLYGISLLNRLPRPYSCYVNYIRVTNLSCEMSHNRGTRSGFQCGHVGVRFPILFVAISVGYLPTLVCLYTYMCVVSLNLGIDIVSHRKSYDF